MSIAFVNHTSRAAIAPRFTEQRCPRNWNELTMQGDYHLPFATTGARSEAAKWRCIIFAPVLVLAVLIFALQPAKASDAPWCAVILEGYWDCQYHSIEECRPNVVAGNRGFCNLNPRWPGWYRERRYLRN